MREHLSSNFKVLKTSYTSEYQSGFSGFDTLSIQTDALMGADKSGAQLLINQGQSLATLQRTTIIHSVMDAVLQDRLSSANKWASINQETLLSQIMKSSDIQELLKQQGKFREVLRNKFIGSDPNSDTYKSQEAAYNQIKVTLGLDDADVKVRVKEMLSQYAKMVSSSFVKATQAMPNPVVHKAAEDDEYLAPQGQ